MKDTEKLSSKFIAARICANRAPPKNVKMIINRPIARPMAVARLRPWGRPPGEPGTNRVPLRTGSS